MNPKIEMCEYYTTTRFPQMKPKCLQGLFANLKCHSKNNCPRYQPSKEGPRNES